MTAPYIDPQTVHTPSVGTAPPASWGTTVRNGLETLARAPGCVIVSASSPGTNLNASWTSIKFDAADSRDTDNFHSPTVNPERVTIPAGMGGWYHIAGTVVIGASSSGSRMVRLLINGSTARALNYASASTMTVAMVLPFVVDVLLNAGDYFELQAQMSIAGPLASTAQLAARLVAWP